MTGSQESEFERERPASSRGSETAASHSPPPFTFCTLCGGGLMRRAPLCLVLEGGRVCPGDSFIPHAAGEISSNPLTGVSMPRGLLVSYGYIVCTRIASLFVEFGVLYPAFFILYHFLCFVSSAMGIELSYPAKPPRPL